MAKTKKPETPATEPESATEVPAEPGRRAKHASKFSLAWLKPSNLKTTIRRHPIRSVVVGVVLATIIALLAIPMTRYAILGSVISKDVSVSVIDANTGKPVSSATVAVDDKQAQSNNSGNATLHVKLGNQRLKIEKKYYKNFSQKITVTLSNAKNRYQVKLQATGRQVPLTVINKITGKPLENATIKAADTEAKTDKDGKAIIVLPADKTSLAATISADKYNDNTISIKVTADSVPENNFTLTPSGKVYFLSKLSGKIDVVKTDLDGSHRQTVLAATGFESDTQTVLLASRDWKYLALQAKRDNKAKYSALYIIETENNDKLRTADEGNATFTISGWLNHSFVYTAVNNDLADSQPGKNKLKSINAETGKLTTIDQTTSEGVGSGQIRDWFNNVFLLEDRVFYLKGWVSYYNPSSLTGKQHQAITVKSDGSDKKVVKGFDATSTYVYAAPYSVNEIYIRTEDRSNPDTNHYYEYDDGAIKEISLSIDEFNKTYPTPLTSPSGKLTFWSEDRDGKGTILLADDEGKNEKSIAAVEDAVAYGWYSDDYLLIAKKGSELYIMSADGGTPLKVTDYHKPVFNFRGYGGGYGGF